MAAGDDPGLERIRALERSEVDLLIDWAAQEGWNPGLADADAFWATDPGAFVGVERDGELIGAGSIVSYGGEHGFIGLFIVRPELRGEGVGRRIWDRLCEPRGGLREEAAIGLDGVPEMEAFYAESGFRLSHQNLRMRGTGRDAGAGPDLRPLGELPFEAVAAFDRAHFGFDREAFLRRWIDPAGGAGVGLLEGGELRGIGVVRPCREGFKIGPLFAAAPEAAERVFAALSDHAAGEPLLLDVPERNRGAMALAARHGMREVFACARMYRGPAPELPWERIFGVTTFELG